MSFQYCLLVLSLSLLLCQQPASGQGELRVNVNVELLNIVHGNYAQHYSNTEFYIFYYEGVSLELNGNPVINFGLLAHSDIDTSDDREVVGGNLVCRTDLTACCRYDDAQGSWYYTTGGRVLFNFEGSLPSGQIYRLRRGAQVVRLRRDGNANIAATANGIYHCEVADQNGVLQTRYVGLYTEGAGELG